MYSMYIHIYIYIYICIYIYIYIYTHRCKSRRALPPTFSFVWGRGCAKRLKRSRAGRLCDYPQANCTTAHRFSRHGGPAFRGFSAAFSKGMSLPQWIFSAHFHRLFGGIFQRSFAFLRVPGCISFASAGTTSSADRE